MKTTTSLFLILVFLLDYCSGQAINDDNLGRSIDSLVTLQFRQNEPGVSILVGKHGKIVYEKAFGSADIELHVPLKPGMLFKIGSVTKQFTAIGILQLVERGKISLQDSLQKYIPDFPHKRYTITIENLLTHTSGIMDYGNADTTHNPYIEREEFTPGRIIGYIKNAPLEFRPGTKYSYSNSGYVLLGYIIERVTGESYHRYMMQNVIKPAGLTHTLFADEHTILPNRVRGYTRDRGFYENCEYQSISLAFAAGDLWSTSEDLYTWNKALLAYKLVKKETLDKAFTPFRLANGEYSRYGYGWFIDTLAGSLCIHHEGQINGFIAEEKYFPAEDTYVALLTNVKSSEDTTSFSDDRFRLFEKIALLAAGKHLANEVNVNDLILDSYVGKYQATSKRNNVITIYKKEGKLYADLSNGTGRNMVLEPQSATLFFLPDVARIHTTFEFIKENGKTVKLIATQEKKYEFKKIE
jgi:CubicO group peptidase (beta-lactamase class C family)